MTTADIQQEQVFEAHVVACLTFGLGYVDRWQALEQAERAPVVPPRP